MEKLVDSYGREIVYFRISLTDRCNFRCLYCSPSDCNFCFIKHENILRFEEILEISKVAVQMGMNKIRLTGGEPLVRKGVIDFIKKLKTIERLEDISLTTNGFYLPEMAKLLKQAGLNRVNISIDSLQKEKFIAITGFDSMEKVLQGIDAALQEGLTPVKINVVLLKGINDDEIEDFINLTIDKPLNVRFIELMPTNHSLTQINEENYISAQTVKNTIINKYPDMQPAEMEKGFGPASYFQLPNAKGKFGFINAVSQHFCASCNRLRLTAEGSLRPCLFSSKEIKLKEKLREIPQNQPEKREEIIRQCFKKAIQIKPFRHHIESKNTTEFDMSKIGG